MRRILALLLLFAAVGEAGGGPETTLLVVNSESPASKRIANEWAAWRDIPSTHVLYLDRIPHLRVIPLSVFLERIWKPIENYMNEAGLKDRIDLIAYSADFPYGVDFKERQEGGKLTVGSLTGLTYLIRQVQEDGTDFWSPQSNRYFRRAVLQARTDRRRANAAERGHFSAGQQALQAGDHKAAAAAFKKLLSTYDVHPDIWFQYARCLAQLGKTKEALDAFEESVDLQFEQINLVGQVPEFKRLRGNARFQSLVKRLEEGGAPMQPAVAFSSNKSWGGGDDAHRYYLSAMLAYTGEWGNSTPEALAYLGAAAKCDGTNPDGTVYLLVNSDIRARTRQPFFAATAAGLKKRGRKVEILEQKEDGQTGVVPNGKGDVMGAVMGKAGYSWKGSKSKVLPGAICENLTSFGAVFKNGSQTKLTELLRAGAAGSSGTVTEPYATWWKFPHPYLHVHYADGASLAEAFYQSVSGPYQLLVVGDPLAQPFAKIPKIEAVAPPAGGAWRGLVKLGAKVDADAVVRWELWVDGSFAGSAPAGGEVELDTTKFPDGSHELRFVAIGNGTVASRGSAKRSVVTNNHDEGIQTRAPSDVPFDGEYVVEGTAESAETIELWQGSRRVASAEPNDGSFKIVVSASTFGRGPVSLSVRAKAAGELLAVERRRVVVGSPSESSEPLRKSGPILPGLAGTVTLQDGTTEPVALTTLGDDGGRSVHQFLRRKKVKRLALEGEFEAPVDGEYRLILQTGGAAELDVDVPGHILTDIDISSDQIQIPLFLEAGWHPIRLMLEPKGAPRLFVLLGGETVTRPLRTHVSAGKELKKKPSPAKGQESLFDGKHAGEAVEITPESSVAVSFKTTQRGIARIVLFPEPSKLGVKSWPGAWTVERQVKGKWIPVEELVPVVARSAKRPPSDRKKKIAAVEIPDYVLFTFKPVDAKKIRLTPASGTARLVEVGIYQAEKQRK